MKANLIHSLAIFLIVCSGFPTSSQEQKWLGKWSGKLDISSTTLEINLNHLFQTCETGAVAEYAHIEETISPIVLEFLRN